jgi:hypothetical protein
VPLSVYNTRIAAIRCIPHLQMHSKAPLTPTNHLNYFTFTNNCNDPWELLERAQNVSKVRLGSVSVMWQSLPVSGALSHLLDHFGTRYRSCLRLCATSREIANSRSMIFFFNLSNPSRHNIDLGLTFPLAEISTRNLPRSKARPVLKADDFTTICEPIV